MADAVNATRRYDSPRRREQAAATRREILDAAERLFADRGYAATTIAAIAGEAGVAVKTVYLAFETKAGLLRALWHLRLRGERDDVRVSEQPWFREVVDEPDPERKLRLNARNARAVKVRAGELMETLRTAAPSDPDIAELWERINAQFRDNQRSIAEMLPLRPGLDVEDAADIMWTLNHPDVWQLLVGRRGWTPEEREEWLVTTLRAQLLG